MPHPLCTFSSSEWAKGVDSPGKVRALSRAADPRYRRRRPCFRMKLNRVETIGAQFVELEKMAGTTILGLLSIKNNTSAFLHVLSFNKNIPDALNAQDLYGNTPSHYFALRGKETCGLLAYLREMGACILANRAHQTPQAVQVSRHIVCCEDGDAFGASYCAIRQVVSVVPNVRVRHCSEGEQDDGARQIPKRRREDHPAQPPVEAEGEEEQQDVSVLQNQ